jgi:hypothetical protein
VRQCLIRLFRGQTDHWSGRAVLREVVRWLSIDREELRPQLEQLRRWFEARGGRLDELFETDAPSPNGGRANGAVPDTRPSAAAPRRAGKPPAWLKASAVATLVAAILTAGAWLGQTWARQAPEQPPIQAPAAPPVTRTVTRNVVPETCLTALRQGDATVRLLRGNVRDRRLDQAVKAYQKSREDCRKQAARH